MNKQLCIICATCCYKAIWMWALEVFTKVLPYSTKASVEVCSHTRMYSILQTQKYVFCYSTPAELTPCEINWISVSFQGLNKFEFYMPITSKLIFFLIPSFLHNLFLHFWLYQPDLVHICFFNMCSTCSIQNRTLSPRRRGLKQHTSFWSSRHWVYYRHTSTSIV